MQRDLGANSYRQSVGGDLVSRPVKTRACSRTDCLPCIAEHRPPSATVMAAFQAGRTLNYWPSKPSAVLNGPTRSDLKELSVLLSPTYCRCGGQLRAQAALAAWRTAGPARGRRSPKHLERNTGILSWRTPRPSRDQPTCTNDLAAGHQTALHGANAYLPHPATDLVCSVQGVPMLP